jgi:CheY-like chemotaxis protein
LKVLIVDDNEEIVFIVGMLLEDEGFEIRTAMDGEEGFRVFLEFEPDLIITDIQMPRENGIELMKHIRGFNPLVKNIYMSGDLRRFRPLLEEEREKYSVSLLEKPFSKDELMGLVSEVAARRGGA